MSEQPLTEHLPSKRLESIRIQAEAIIETPQRVHRPGQVVVRNGIIVECTADCSNRADIELPGSILSAGLVNAHTHLEFSDLRQPYPAGKNFPEWIGSVIRHRRTILEQNSIEECLKLRRAALQLGYEESRQAGVELVGDIVTRPWSASDLDGLNSQGRSISGAVPIIVRNSVAYRDCAQHFNGTMAVFAFPEIIGLDEARFDEATAWATQLANSEKSEASLANPVWQVGLSPHAPYSVHFPTMEKALATNNARQRVTAMHVAESLDELEWLQCGSGPFREVFERLGVPADAPRAAITQVIEWLATRNRALLIHGNYLSKTETDQVAQAGMAVVYCPRTHRHFAHREYPLKCFCDANINVVLGTDSRASNPDLDLWNEVLCLRESHPWIRPEWAFDAVTRRAAQALGVEQHFGSLQPGRVAMFNISRFDPTIENANILDELTSQPRPFTPLVDVLLALSLRR